MKKTFFLFLIVATTMLSSCGPSATHFNDVVVQSHTSALGAQNRFESKLQNAINADEVGVYAALKIDADSAIAVIDADITKVKALDVPSDGENFKESVLSTLEAAKEIVEVGTKFASIKETTTEDEKNKLINEYNTLVEKGSKIEDEMLKAQADFAKSKGIKLQ